GFGRNPAHLPDCRQRRHEDEHGPRRRDGVAGPAGKRLQRGARPEERRRRSSAPPRPRPPAPAPPAHPLALSTTLVSTRAPAAPGCSPYANPAHQLRVVLLRTIRQYCDPARRSPMGKRFGVGIFSAAVLALSALPARAVTVEDIVARHIDALGGAARIR